MKIKIEYKSDNDERLNCCAYTYIDGVYYSAWDNTFNEAKERLLKKIAAPRPTPPELEEVEI